MTAVPASRDHTDAPQRHGHAVFAYVLLVVAGLCVGALEGLVLGLVTGLIPFVC